MGKGRKAAKYSQSKKSLGKEALDLEGWGKHVGLEEDDSLGFEELMNQGS